MATFSTKITCIALSFENIHASVKFSQTVSVLNLVAFEVRDLSASVYILRTMTLFWLLSPSQICVLVEIG